MTHPQGPPPPPVPQPRPCAHRCGVDPTSLSSPSSPLRLMSTVPSSGPHLARPRPPPGTTRLDGSSPPSPIGCWAHCRIWPPSQMPSIVPRAPPCTHTGDAASGSRGQVVLPSRRRCSRQGPMCILLLAWSAATTPDTVVSTPHQVSLCATLGLKAAPWHPADMLNWLLPAVQRLPSSDVHDLQA